MATLLLGAEIAPFSHSDGQQEQDGASALWALSILSQQKGVCSCRAFHLIKPYWLCEITAH